MPTVLRFDGLRVVIYPNDHFPSHVHVIGAGNEAVFELNCPRGPTALRENYGFAARELRKIAATLNQAVEALCERWSAIHDAD